MKRNEIRQRWKVFLNKDRPQKDNFPQVCIKICQRGKNIPPMNYCGKSQGVNFLRNSEASSAKTEQKNGTRVITINVAKNVKAQFRK